MPSLVRGRVVYPLVPIPDPQGRNPKAGRPFVVISSNEDLTAGQAIQAVGITTNLTQSPPEDYVALPWGRNARTGLTEESAALCTWVIEVAQDAVNIGKGFVDPRLVLRIVERIRAILESKPEEPKGNDDCSGVS